MLLKQSVTDHGYKPTYRNNARQFCLAVTWQTIICQNALAFEVHFNEEPMIVLEVDGNQN
jgi:hypothetical protein